jgi:GTPase-associated protein 1, N-terminal domain type 2/GTPase-associated protein 1, middle domain
VAAEHVGSDPEVSHPQAFHTSCRHGLDGRSGFQFNAASAGIEPELLRALTATHVGYQAPRDLPREPTGEQLRTFPVSLKSRAVEGTPVVSQTVYVGREFRGRAGEPDSGRFGNYFSHIVLADRAAAEPFDGLLPIELWRAPHWCSEESEVSLLPELGPLQPGGCDLEWTLEQLDSRRGWLGKVLDGALAALDGGPRVVLVEPDVELAAAWVAWVSYALPTDLARALTFTTFTGQPRHAQDVQFCVTTPGCDLAFAEHELAREVLLLDVTSTEPASPQLLYARVAAALASDGPEAIAAAAASVSDGAAQRRGAQLAISRGRLDLAAPEHVPSLLELVIELGRSGQWELALQTVRELPQGLGSEEALRGWWSVHASARLASAEPARELADQALERLIERVADAAVDLPAVSCDSPTSPSPGVLARWLERVEQSPGGVERAAVLHGGLRLGLVGCNVALDRRVASAIGEAIESPEVAQLLATLATDARYAYIADQAIAGLAREAFADERAIPRLSLAIADPALSETTRRLAEQADDFDERAVWERLRVEADPTALADALTTLVSIAAQAGRAEEVKLLFGREGPVSVEDHALLFRAFARCGAGVPTEDIGAALAALAREPLNEAARARPLTKLLHSAVAPGRVREEPVLLAWMAACRLPSASIAEWCECVADAAAAPPERFPEERRRELSEIAGDVTVDRLIDLTDPENRRRRISLATSDPRRSAANDPFVDYADGIRWLAWGFAERWPEIAAGALKGRLAKGRDKARFGAAAFVVWGDLPPDTGHLLETALPQAVEQLAPRRVQAIEDQLDEREQEEWALWLERHPPGQGGAVSRLLRREGR